MGCAEIEFQSFLDKVEAQRQEEAEVVTTLECPFSNIPKTKAFYDVRP